MTSSRIRKTGMHAIGYLERAFPKPDKTRIELIANCCEFAHFGYALWATPSAMTSHAGIPVAATGEYYDLSQVVV